MDGLIVGLDILPLQDSHLFRLVVLPLLIFLARVADVSLGTLRTVFVSRGTKNWAAILGFFEVLIWLLAISYILDNLTNVATYIAYASGFAMGNYVGLRLEERIALGFLGVTIITHRDATELINHLKELRFGLTSVSAKGSTGRVRIVYSVIRRKQLEQLRQVVERFHPQAFMAVQVVKSVSREVYPLALPRTSWWPFSSRGERHPANRTLEPPVGKEGPSQSRSQDKV